MYTNEERKRAVELYLKYGKKGSAVIRELGYPSSCQTLKAWLKESRSKKGLKPIREKYSLKEKKRAVNFYLEHGKQKCYTIRRLGYPSQPLLDKWIKELVSEENIPIIASTVEGKKEEEKSAKAWKKEDKPVKNRGMRKGINTDFLTLGDVDKITSVDEAKSIIAALDRDIALSNERLEELEKQIRKAEIKLAVYEKAVEVLKKDKGINIKEMTNREKTIVIDALRTRFKVKELLPVLEISKSSYCYVSSSLKRDKYATLRRRIKELFNESHARYGYRRIHALLIREGNTISEKIVRRIMKEDKLIVGFAKKKKYSSYKGEISPSVPNVIKRDFHAAKPNEKWLTDITEFSLPKGKVYLSPIIDCFDGMIVSWTIGTSPNAELVNTMLENGITLLSEDEKPIIHSDRGCHYRWPEWIQKTKEAGLTRSMSKKGCSPDNSACEGFFGRLKNEMFYGYNWNGVTTKEFIAILNNYIHWYNEKRIKVTLGGLSPLEYRDSLLNTKNVI